MKSAFLATALTTVLTAALVSALPVAADGDRDRGGHRDFDRHRDFGGHRDFGRHRDYGGHGFIYFGVDPAPPWAYQRYDLWRYGPYGAGGDGLILGSDWVEDAYRFGIHPGIDPRQRFAPGAMVPGGFVHHVHFKGCGHD